jgi:hypothetical protein
MYPCTAFIVVQFAQVPPRARPSESPGPAHRKAQRPTIPEARLGCEGIDDLTAAVLRNTCKLQTSLKFLDCNLHPLLKLIWYTLNPALHIRRQQQALSLIYITSGLPSDQPLPGPHSLPNTA